METIKKEFYNAKIKKEVKDLNFDSVILNDSKISNVASMYSGKGVGLTVILYIYDGATPSVSLEMKDASYIDLLEEACGQIGYVFWIENFTIHILPETKLAEHKNPKQRVIRSVIRK